MTNEVLWTITNAGSEMLPALRNNCSLEDGTLLETENWDGTFTTVCMRDLKDSPATAARTRATSEAASAKSTTIPGASFAGTPGEISKASPDKRFTDLGHLHPIVRKGVQAIQEQLDEEGIPMRVFEAFRSPQRQQMLYNKGRTTAGSKVTNAKAFESYHQYGMAADFVRFEDGKWNWNTRTSQQRAEWKRFHEIALKNGLEPLSWEMPHVQIVDVELTELRNGLYPDGGDESWVQAMGDAVSGWSGSFRPPVPTSAERPTMASPLIGTSGGTPATGFGGALNWTSRFGGDAWAYDKQGFYTRDHTGKLKSWRTPGAPITVQEVMAKLGTQISASSAKYGVPPELIIMTIATETAAYRKVGFTGTRTFRWEQGYTVGATGNPALDGKEKGDYSAGPMQVLSDTARWMNNTKSLGYDNDTTFKFFKNKPSKVPADVGLYDPATCIDVGTSYIKHQMASTDGNPLLVAAAYNAGSLKPSSKNHWRLRSHGNHLDRAAEWYGDACFVLYG